jgi:hypothetical protein
MDKLVWFAAGLAALVSLGLMYIDSKLFDKPKSNLDYFKGMLMGAILVGFTVYLLRPASSGISYGGYGQIPSNPPVMTGGAMSGIAPF